MAGSSSKRNKIPVSDPKREKQTLFVAYFRWHRRTGSGYRRCSDTAG